MRLHDVDPPARPTLRPLAFAVLRKQTSAVRLLLERGARVDIADGEARRLISIARTESTADIVALLGRD